MTSDFSQLIGSTPELSAVINAAKVVAVTDVTVLIQGESGTGKELLAQAIHGSSRRAARTLVTINCAALPESLVESELFGHRRGAFTGASQDYPGRICAADGGTVFLDEIGELPLAVQAKLLRFLESGECQPVGAVSAVRVDVRVLAATNRDLSLMVKQGAFREDLYYRLQVVPLELPPLRVRGADVPRLLQHGISHFTRQYALPAPRFSAAAMRCLRAYAWPGNVRELRNLCERLVILLPGQEVQPDNLPKELRQPPVAAALTASPAAATAPGSLVEMEKSLLQQALQRYAGNQSRAARSLGLTRDTFLYRLKKYGISYRQPSLTTA